MKKTLVLSLIVMILLTACKKPKEPGLPAVSERMQWLTTGQWKMSAYKFDSDNDGLFETDRYPSLPLCVRDNYTIYKTDGTFEWYEGPILCDPAHPEFVLGDWRFDHNESEIWLNGGPWQIQELSSSTLHIWGTGFMGGGTIEFTYIK
jgi:hypothetical protein